MAVHTKLSKTNINKILLGYKLGKYLRSKGIKEGIENTNYLIETDKSKFILTIFENRVNKSQIPFFFEVMINSNSCGIDCPVPIKNNNGEYVNVVKEKKMAIFNFLEGRSKKVWNDNDCFLVGEKLARFHFANKNSTNKSKNIFGTSYWKRILKKCENDLDRIIPNSRKIIKDEISFISSNWPKNLPMGIIHADLFPDNVFFQRNKISGFLDFYFSCNDFLLYDIAITLNAWCFKNKKFKENYFNSLLRGYESIRRISKNEKKNINIFLRGASLRFLLTRMHDFIYINENKFVKKKNPIEFFNILLFHMKKTSKDYPF
ncbi:MAG: homoserine kinase [Pseudomonadota bacterium]|nr:homoserine kinase [Pseudomonadota bacterium]